MVSRDMKHGQWEWVSDGLSKTTVVCIIAAYLETGKLYIQICKEFLGTRVVLLGVKFLASLLSEYRYSIWNPCRRLSILCVFGCLVM